MLCCCKDYKNFTRDKKFLRSRFLVCFREFVTSFLRYKRFFSLFVFCFFFHFSSTESYFLKYKKFFRGFRFPKYYNFLNIRNRKFLFWKNEGFFWGEGAGGGDFFSFWSLGLKSASEGSKIYC